MVDYGYIDDTFVLPNAFVPDCGIWATFTPTVTLVGGAGNVVPVYTTNSGRQCKAGRIIFVDVLLDGDGGNEGAGTGVINIALSVTSGASKIVNLRICGVHNNGSGEELIFGTIAQSASVISLKTQTAIRTISSFTGADQDNVARKIELNFWYEVD